MGLFDTKKEQKSIKLVKKLQEQANLEWEKEVQCRREQELNDEAIAKELQAQLEDEERHASNSNSPFTATTVTTNNNTSSYSSNAPPPLPTKPREYNNSTIPFVSSPPRATATTITATTTSSDRPSNYSSSSRPNNSSNRASIPSAASSASLSTPAIKPLYKLPSATTSESQPTLPPRTNTPANKKKSYLTSQTYKPSVSFALTSPSPSPSSVFYQKTPALTPAAIPPQIIMQNNASASSSTAMNNSTPSSSSSSNNNTNNRSSSAYPNSGSSGTNNSNSSQLYNNTATPTRLSAVEQTNNKPINHMAMPEPVDMTPTSYTSLAAQSATSSYDNTRPNPPNNVSSSSYSEPIVLPLQPQLSQNFHSQQQTAPNVTQYPNYNNNAAVNATPFPQNYQEQQQQHNISPPTANYPNHQQQQPMNHNNTPFPANYHQQPQNSNVYPNYQAEQHSQNNNAYGNYQQPPERQHKDATPISLPLGSNEILSNAASNYTLPPQQIYSSSYTAPPSIIHASTAAPPPVQQQHYASAPVLPTTKSSQLPPAPVFNHSTSSLPTNNQQNAVPPMAINNQAVPPTIINNNKPIASTNPYFNQSRPSNSKPLFSDSILSLKPDEDQQPLHATTVEEADDDEDDWDNIPVTKRPATPTPKNKKVSDADSDIDYSDMIYDRRNESEPEETDPFADSFAIEVPKKPSMIKTLDSSIQILDPTMKPAPRKSSTPTLVLNDEGLNKEDKIAEEKEVTRRKEAKIFEEEPVRTKEGKIFEELEEMLAAAAPTKSATNEPNLIHMYEEKESNEIELPDRFNTPIQQFQTPIQQRNRQSFGGSNAFLDHHINTPRPLYQHQKASTPNLFANSTPNLFNTGNSTPNIFATQQQQQQQDDTYSVDSEDIVKVFPTNVLRAGAPTPVNAMSSSNPYSKKQGAVPASDYGYYKENDIKAKIKILPELPQSSTSSEDRHITVASINPGQRVWIRIQPTDTGKMLAERIHIVASYQTRKVTKITTTNGRNIPLDNSPLFEDWNEIIHFKEGEAWTVEWVPIEHPYVDIITEGKEFMKQLKANFRGSSSSSAEK